jgi:hypothetical protein
LSHRLNQFNTWIETINSRNRLSDKLEIIPTLSHPSLNDAWLSGFTDAEGCFNVNIRQRKESVSGYRISPFLSSSCFILDQKDGESVLLYIRNLFQFGHVYLRSSTNNVYRYTSDSF